MSSGRSAGLGLPSLPPRIGTGASMIACGGSQGSAAPLSTLSTSSSVLCSASARSVGTTISSYHTAPALAQRGDLLARLPAPELGQHLVLDAHQLLGPDRAALRHGQDAVGVGVVAVVG